MPSLLFSSRDGTPTLPQSTVDTTLPTGWDGTADKTPGTAAQLAIDLADVGTGSRQSNGGTPYIIELTAGVNYDDTFTIPDGGGADWLIIRSSEHSGELPAAGTRVADKTGMATIVLSGSTSQLKIANGAHHVRLVGIEVLQTHADIGTRRIVETGIIAVQEDVPEYITLDRCFIHGDALTQNKGGVNINANNLAIIDSRISDIHNASSDTQAISIYECDGPILIHNNFLSATTEGLIIGGGKVDVTDMMPADITITNNYFYKPNAWNPFSIGYTEDDVTIPTGGWYCKNGFELKVGRRVLIEGNVIDGTWYGADGQQEALVFTVRNQDGNAGVWSTIQDLTVRFNKSINVYSALEIAPIDNALRDSVNMQRVNIHDNLFIMDVTNRGGAGTNANYRTIGLNREKAKDVSHTGNQFGEYITINHNTFAYIATPYATALFSSQDQESPPVDQYDIIKQFTFTNNIIYDGATADWGGSGANDFNATMTKFVTKLTCSDNVCVQGGSGDVSSTYTGFNWAEDEEAVNFTNTGIGDYSLAGPPYQNAGSDGEDIGADIVAINNAIMGVV